MNTNLVSSIESAISSDEILVDLIKIFNKHKETEIYLVGGYIRDIIINKKSYDRDFVVLGQSGIAYAEKIASLIKGHFVLLDKENDIARVVLEDKVNVLDFSGSHGTSIEEDLSRRDFTVNAISYKLTGNRYLNDPYNGHKDIINKQIKMISKKNLIDDPLRLLRAYRIASLINGSISYETLDIIKNNYKLLENVAIERINTEFNKLLADRNSYEYIKQLSDVGILELLIPELTDQRKVPSNVYHHLGLYDHMLDVYRQLEILLLSSSDRINDHLYSYLNATTQRIVPLKYSALLHDVGKPNSWNIDETGKHTFIGHGESGAIIAEKVAKRLKNSKTVVKLIQKLVKNHLYPSQLSQGEELPTIKAMNRFYRKMDSETQEIILLAMADRLAAQGPLITYEILSRNMKELEYILENYYVQLEKIEKLPKLLDGNDVIRLLGISPGPLVGKILKTLMELQTEEVINTKEEAERWILQSDFNDKT